MDILVTLGEGSRVDAHFKGFTVHTDQAKVNGGDETAPDPFSYFLSSLATCAGFFVSKFCQSRQISTEGIQLQMTNDWNNEKKLMENVRIQINVPPSFPEKYLDALVRATQECSVKKALANPPLVEVTTQVTS
jgi:ribosomal protein S12 methylthiotransferase accessory factor